MNRRFSAFFVLGGLTLIGAGCGGSAKVSAPQFVPDTTSLTKLIVPAEPASAVSFIDTTAMPKTWTFPDVLPAAEITGKQIRITTAKGDIAFSLFEKDAPKTVSNFVYLAQGGYFDGLTFHRREPGFVIQGGDPNGNGTGGPGYKFEDEPVSRSYARGIVAMANSGPDTNGSQFFIMLADTPLPPSYTIFGVVTSGMETVDKIAVGDVMAKVTVEEKE